MKVWQLTTVAVCSWLMSTNAMASAWKYGTVYADISDKTQVHASVANPDGRYFRVVRNQGEDTVWIEFGVPMREGSAGLESFPVMRVDDRNPLDTSLLLELENLGRKQYHLSPTSFLASFPSSDSLKQGTGFLYDLVAGNTLKVRYWTSDGASHRVEFSLAGSKQAIGRALGVNSIATPAQARSAQLVQERWGHYSTQCAKKFSPHVEGAVQPNAEFLEMCLGWANACATIVADAPAQFDACFVRHRDIFVSCVDYGEGKSIDVIYACIDLQLAHSYPDHPAYALTID